MPYSKMKLGEKFIIFYTNPFCFGSLLYSVHMGKRLRRNKVIFIYKT